MIRKTLIMTGVLALVTATACYADENFAPKAPHPYKKETQNLQKPQKGPDFAKRHAEFEQRLKLTDEQKAKAAEIRKKGFEQIKPLMDKLKEKKAEVEAVKKSKIAVQDQQEKLAQLHKEIGALKRGMHELRVQNMKEFEAILTKKQLKELKKMKEEGRKKLEQARKNNPPIDPKFGRKPLHVPTPLPIFPDKE